MRFNQPKAWLQSLALIAAAFVLGGVLTHSVIGGVWVAGAFILVGLTGALIT